MSSLVYAQWTAQSSGVTTPFRGVYFSDSMHGIFVGDNSTVVRTTDGGQTWEKQTVPNSGLFLEDAYFFNDNEGIIVGDKVFKTSNGGATWTTVSISGNPAFTGVDFVNALTGYACGGGGKIYTTLTGGSSWLPQSTGSNVFFSDIDFANADTGVAVGFAGVIFRTTNGGTLWSAVNSGTSNNLFSVFCITPKRIVAVGGDGNALNGNILTSTDGGMTWNSSIVDPNSILTGVHFIDSNVGYVGGTRIWKTMDGGQHWTMQKDDGETTVLFFTDALTGYAGDHGGRIFHTTNGGTTGINQGNNVPGNFQLYQNYPNPFNPATTISFEISKSEFVELTVYDIQGRVITKLINQYLTAGSHQASFDASHMASGVYYYQIRAGEFLETKKMVVLK